MTAETVQAGHQYPNVVRVLKPDSGGENNSEWWYYANGGAYPWPGVQPVLTWVAPTERVDGSTLVPIANYMIDYGGVDTVTDPGLLVQEVVAGDVLFFNMPTPESGKTYRARITATDTDGKKSQLSGFVYVTAQ